MSSNNYLTSNGGLSEGLPPENDTSGLPQETSPMISSKTTVPNSPLISSTTSKQPEKSPQQCGGGSCGRKPETEEEEKAVMVSQDQAGNVPLGLPCLFPSRRSVLIICQLYHFL